MLILASSPIETWEGAAAFFPYANSFGAVAWFWIAVILCIVPLFVSFGAEKRAEREHGG